MGDDVSVIANRMRGHASQIALERSETAVELLEDDDLGFDVTDCLRDNLLGEFSDDSETLLNDLDFLCVADNLMVLYDNLVVATAVEVPGTVEVVEVIKGRKSAPVVEGNIRSVRRRVVTAGQIFSSRYGVDWGGKGTGGQDSRNDHRFEEHGEYLMR